MLRAPRGCGAAGLRIVTASEDAQGTIQTVAVTLGLEAVLSEAKPHDKVALVQRLKSEGRRVAMADAGVNDAAMDIGIAMVTGTGVAMPTA